MSNPSTGPIGHASACDKPERDEAPRLELLVKAKACRDEILEKLDDVYGVVLDGPEMSHRKAHLLSLLPEENLEQIVSYAEEYAENVRDYAKLARNAIRAKAERRASKDGA